MQGNVINTAQTFICIDSPTRELTDSQQSRRSCNYIQPSTNVHVLAQTCQHTAVL